MDERYNCTREQMIEKAIWVSRMTVEWLTAALVAWEIAHGNDYDYRKIRKEAEQIVAERGQ